MNTGHYGHGVRDAPHLAPHPAYRARRLTPPPLLLLPTARLGCRSPPPTTRERLTIHSASEQTKGPPPRSPLTGLLLYKEVLFLNVATTG